MVDQDYPNLEYIVIDGGSTDGSDAIIGRHADRLSYWVSERDKGQTDALIKGFSRATGDIQGWLCSDDLLLPDALSIVGHFFSKHPEVNAAYGDALWIDQRGKFIRPKKEMAWNTFVFVFDHDYIPQPSMFWRRRLYERVGGLDPWFNLAMDSDLWERFSRSTKVMRIPRYLSCMRYYPDQKTRSLRSKGIIEDEVIRSRFPLFKVKPLRPALYVVARMTRFLSKGVAGGYGAHVPAEVLQQIARYEIESE